MKKLGVRFTRAPGEEEEVGTLAEEGGRLYFEYAAGFLAGARSLSPFRLPFAPSLFQHQDRDFGPLPGLFDDSLPDGWGLLLMDRRFRSLGLDLRAVSPLDRLAYLGTRTMGALTYHPPSDPSRVDARLLSLHHLSLHAEEVLSGAAVEVLPQLLRAGGSPGGARPKLLVGLDAEGGRMIAGEEDLPQGFAHWIVKLAARANAPDAGPLEYAYGLMAAAAGIDLPERRLIETVEGDRFFAVKRFDRDQNNRRFHVHSFGGLLQINYRVPSADYADLLRATSVLTRDHREVRSVYRRAVFNVLAHNRDDHVKNFAFILDDATGAWRASPAYDLLFTAGPGGEHSMTVAGEGRDPGRPHLLRLAERAGLSKREAATILDQVGAAVSCWPRHAECAGVSRAELRRVARALPKLG